jgi:hypothetical protein
MPRKMLIWPFSEDLEEAFFMAISNAKRHKVERQFTMGINYQEEAITKGSAIIRLMDNFKPLDPRPYKIKKPKLEFFCPLCKTKRGLAYGVKLTLKNYIQITIVTLFFYPIFGFKVFIVFLSLVAIMEFFLRSLVKNEIPCPYCGFDATLYSRDTKIARKKVQEFLGKKENFEQRAP